MSLMTHEYEPLKDGLPGIHSENLNIRGNKFQPVISHTRHKVRFQSFWLREVNTVERIPLEVFEN